MPTHDVDGKRIAFAGFGIAAAIALVIAAVFALLHLWRMPPQGDRARSPEVTRAAPRLQGAPQLDLARYRADKQRLLAGGAWLDERHTAARIPIGTAMGLLAEAAMVPASQPERQP